MWWKKTAALLLAAVIAVSVCGCVGADAEVFGEEKVLEYVDSICSEPYELLGSELIAQTPDNVEYRFRTMGRGLEFTANSCLSQISIDATETSFYTREISCSYLAAVRELYYDAACARAASYAGYQPESGWMYLTGFSQIGDLVDAVLSADEAYRPELAYNEPDFLRENPVMQIHLVWYPSEEAAQQRREWVNITDLAVNGQNERDELYDRVANAYAQLCVDQKITDPQVPTEYLAGKHRSYLDQIELNGKRMAYDDQENPYNSYGLTTDDYCYSWYSEEQGSYMLVSDIGFYSDSMSMPLILREYVHALGGSYSLRAEGDTFVSSWTIGENSWEMKAVYEKDVRSVRLTKNGCEIPFEYVTVDQERSIGATFCIGLTADQFAGLFGLRWEADEAAGRLCFYSEE